MLPSSESAVFVPFMRYRLELWVEHDIQRRLAWPGAFGAGKAPSGHPLLSVSASRACAAALLVAEEVLIYPLEGEGLLGDDAQLCSINLVGHGLGDPVGVRRLATAR